LSCQYRYSQPIRQAAKAVLLVALLSVPARGLALYREVEPLPRELSGYLLDAKGPVIGATVRVISDDGVDLTVTENTNETDSLGFYIVRAAERVSRRSHLVALVAGCSTPVILPLTRDAESAHQSAGPVFRHIVQCGVPK
jgi:hypothetical protein